MTTEPAGVDWRSMFVRYAEFVGECEGVDFLYPPGHYKNPPWTAEEWAAIEQAFDTDGSNDDDE